MRVLCGDIGGTHTRLAMCETDGTGVQIVRQQVVPSSAYPDLESPVRAFLDTAGPAFEVACLAVPGPVRDRRCETTNLPWIVDADRLSGGLGIERISLLNDLEAAAWGIPALSEQDLLTIQEGQAAPRGNASVIAPGTGLGEAGLYWDGSRHRPFASEGGHADFAPTDEREFALQQFLAGRFKGHVSWERVVSGAGIVHVHEFLTEYRGVSIPAWLQAELRRGDPAAAISVAAMNRACAVCQESLELFVALLGREAGNHALKILSLGGVFLAGGIVPKILPLLTEGAFLHAFLAKGRMAPLMRRMAVRVVLNDSLALFGAALFAASATGRSQPKLP